MTERRGHWWDTGTLGHWDTGTLPTRQLAYRGHVTISASTGTDAGTGGIDSAYRGTHASDFCLSSVPLSRCSFCWKAFVGIHPPLHFRDTGFWFRPL